MKNLIQLIVLLTLVSCSSAPKITKWTSPDLRIAIDSDSLDPANYVMLEESLVNSGKFFVVDRGIGMKAAIKEQNDEHFVAFDRFSDEDRYSRLRKLYGVGSIVVGAVKCVMKHSIFKGDYMHCRQNLALINSSTAEVIAAVSGESDSAEQFYGAIRIPADWQDTVEKLMAAIPETYKPSEYDQRMQFYRKEVRQESINEREAK